MGPINRIHLGLGISPELPGQNVSVANSLFSGPIFDPKKVPGPTCRPGDPKSNPGSKNPPLGMKKQKMRAAKPCRTPASEFQTEPYSESDGQKTFWRVPINILKYVRGKSCPQKGTSCIQKGKSCIQKGESSIQKGKPCMQEGKSWIQKRDTLHARMEILHSRKGIPMGPWTIGPWDQGPWDQGP